MSDDIAESSAHPGPLSPLRDIDTHRYRVLADLPALGMQAGDEFTAWAQGEVFASVSGRGLGAAKNADIAAWLAAGLIEEVRP